ncbi:hypothetical protein [Salinarimonas ramus]|uniref:Uncharacterized protein n=1 Tax=Salinarimonas ramus TaxID=690164 RepID=A0A917V376_9HYPH|nr:hypothetical protein [Salinarimonas ramus]GGK27941.1 hypothetical protein GCM10011322_13090 [Salinarimonas ramus]
MNDVRRFGAPFSSRLAYAALVVGSGPTQIVSYGTLYYAFAVLEPSISSEFGWSSAWSFGCFSLALLVGGLGALAAIPRPASSRTSSRR